MAMISWERLHFLYLWEALCLEDLLRGQKKVHALSAAQSGEAS